MTDIKLDIKLDIPQGKIAINKSGKAYIIWNPDFKPKFERAFNDTQKFVDNEVVRYLQKYVSFRTGVQAKSIKLSSIIGSGRVIINTPYASYQAYSPRIKKRVGLRGTYPFERMKSDKRDTILKGAAAYQKRRTR